MLFLCFNLILEDPLSSFYTVRGEQLILDLREILPNGLVPEPLILESEGRQLFGALLLDPNYNLLEKEVLEYHVVL